MRVGVVLGRQTLYACDACAAPASRVRFQGHSGTHGVHFIDGFVLRALLQKSIVLLLWRTPSPINRKRNPNLAKTCLPRRRRPNASRASTAEQQAADGLQAHFHLHERRQPYEGRRRRDAESSHDREGVDGVPQ